MQKAGKEFPHAEHVNTVCNNKIKNLPNDFNGLFVVEESYYETNGKRHAVNVNIKFTNSTNIKVTSLTNVYTPSSDESLSSLVRSFVR